MMADTARTFRRRKNRPEEAATREPPIPYFGPPRTVLAARLEDYVCETLRQRGLNPDASSLGLLAPGWTPISAVTAILEVTDEFLTSHDSGGGYWSLTHEVDEQERASLLLINDVWTTLAKPVGWSLRYVVIDQEKVAFRAPNACRRIARAVALAVVSILVPATPGGHHVR